MFENRTPVFGLRDINRSFDRRSVLEGLNLDLYAGDFTLLLGANGSGKSTLLRICSGLMRPDSGSNFFQGKGPGAGCTWKVPPAALIGHAGHQLHLYSLLSVAENLTLTRALLAPGLGMDDYLKFWQLEQVAEKRVNALSRGLQFRVSLARALMHAPGFIFLDEPTSCLDDASLGLLLRFLEKARQDAGSSVVIATHDLGRLSSFASRILVLEDKRISKDSLAFERDEVLAPTTAREKCLEYYQQRNR